MVGAQPYKQTLLSSRREQRNLCWPYQSWTTKHTSAGTYKARSSRTLDVHASCTMWLLRQRPLDLACTLMRQSLGGDQAIEYDGERRTIGLAAIRAMPQIQAAGAHRTVSGSPERTVAQPLHMHKAPIMLCAYRNT